MLHTVSDVKWRITFFLPFLKISYLYVQLFFSFLLQTLKILWHTLNMFHNYYILILI